VLRIGHRRQVGELLDRARPELLPDPVVLAPDLVVGRVRGPVDPRAPQIVERCLDGERRAIERPARR
jgi:hypothetical protein